MGRAYRYTLLITVRQISCARDGHSWRPGRAREERPDRSPDRRTLDQDGRLCAAVSAARSATMRVRIGVSRCLLGDAVRYDGVHRRDSYVADVPAR